MGCNCGTGFETVLLPQRMYEKWIKSTIKVSGVKQNPFVPDKSEPIN